MFKPLNSVLVVKADVSPYRAAEVGDIPRVTRFARYPGLFSCHAFGVQLSVRSILGYEFDKELAADPPSELQHFFSLNGDDVSIFLLFQNSAKVKTLIMIFAQVIVRPRTSIFDPQGEAVKQAIQSLGLSTVREAHVGKCIELQIDTDNVEEARVALEGVCKDLLSNPVIEEFELKLTGGSKPRPVGSLPKRKPVAAKSASKASTPTRTRKAAEAVGANPEADDDAETDRIKALKKQEKAAKKLAKDAKKAVKKAAKQAKEALKMKSGA